MKKDYTPTVFISGANRGIGLEFVQQYLTDGWRVFATYRDEAAAATLKSLKGDLQLFCLDITKIEDVKSVKEKIGSEPIDVFINNAAIAGVRDQTASFGQIDVACWLDVMKTNVLCTIKLTEIFFDLIIKSQGKKIVFISSRSGSISERGKLAYHSFGGTYIYRSSKAALNAVTQSLAFDYTPEGVSVIVLHPGWVKTHLGGEAAYIPVDESVRGMKGIISSFGPEMNGKFYNFDGSIIPW